MQLTYDFIWNDHSAPTKKNIVKKIKGINKSDDHARTERNRRKLK